MSSHPVRHPTAPGALGALAALGAACVTLAACGPSSSGTPDGGTSSTTATGAARSAATGGVVVEGTSYRFELPAAPRFVTEPQETAGHGAVKRRWRYALGPSGPYCVVVAVEQPGFTEAFPQSVLAVFDATHSEAGQHVVRNSSIDGVGGATGGVEQEATFTSRLDDGSSVPARSLERQFLTPGKTLISVSAAGPETQIDGCGLRAVVESLRPTGRELPAPSSQTP